MSEVKQDVALAYKGESEKPKWFPDFLGKIFKKDLPAFNELPEEIDVSQTKFLDFILEFRGEVKEYVVGMLKSSRKHADKVEGDERKNAFEIWYQEFIKKIRNRNGQPEIGETEMMDAFGGVISTDKLTGVTIHNHPGEHPPSPIDTRNFILSTSEQMNLVDADHGTFLIFHTKDSHEKAASVDFRITNNHLDTMWDLLNDDYPQTIFAFKGHFMAQPNFSGFTDWNQPLDPEKTGFPSDMNKRGHALATLDCQVPHF
jgi:hypothetical protein